MADMAVQADTVGYADTTGQARQAGQAGQRRRTWQGREKQQGRQKKMFASVSRLCLAKFTILTHLARSSARLTPYGKCI
jgi:hypothetical protein